MATGLAVDYSVYFAQRFMVTVADGTRNGRMAVAMSETGSAVFLGGLTALAGAFVDDEVDIGVAYDYMALRYIIYGRFVDCLDRLAAVYHICTDHYSCDAVT